MRPLVSVVCGALFGGGLALSGMTDPARVLGFLDIFGAWDPTLLLVMAGALVVALPAFQWLRRHPRPLLVQQFFLPDRTRIDRDLLLGASLFGIGWGIAGWCPGPAIAALGSLQPEVLVFVAAMAAGMALRSWRVRRRVSAGFTECRS